MLKVKIYITYSDVGTGGGGPASVVCCFPTLGPPLENCFLHPWYALTYAIGTYTFGRLAEAG